MLNLIAMGRGNKTCKFGSMNFSDDLMPWVANESFFQIHEPLTSAGTDVYCTPVLPTHLSQLFSIFLGLKHVQLFIESIHCYRPS
jgi:hypothetical protein